MNRPCEQQGVEMQKVVLGRTGLEVTRIGFGGIPIQRRSVEDAVEVIRKALDMGVGIIDTARVYTDSEAKIGAAVRGRSERPVVVTKTYERGADAARRDVDVSLWNLGVPSIDVYLLHNVGSVEALDRVTSRGGALEGLSRAKSDGAIRFIGISGHNPSVLQEALARDLFDVVEVPLNAIEQDSLELIEQARERDVATIIMKPLAGGALKPAAAAIRFVLAHPVTCVVPGMQTIAEVEENLGAEGELSRDEREGLLAEAAKWEGRFCRRCGYCSPECPNNMNIPGILVFASYSQRYGLTEWARERYAEMPVKADACEECGKCEEMCPYNLPIRELLKEAHEELAG